MYLDPKQPACSRKFKEINSLNKDQQFKGQTSGQVKTKMNQPCETYLYQSNNLCVYFTHVLFLFMSHCSTFSSLPVQTELARQLKGFAGWPHFKRKNKMFTARKRSLQKKKKKIKHTLTNDFAHTGPESTDGEDFASPAGRSLEKATHTHTLTHTFKFNLSGVFDNDFIGKLRIRDWNLTEFGP